MKRDSGNSTARCECGELREIIRKNRQEIKTLEKRVKELETENERLQSDVEIFKTLYRHKGE